MVKMYIESSNGKYAGENTEFLNFSYAHGELNKKANGDLLRIDKTEHFDMRKNINGEECIAVLPSGEEVPALYFHWKAVHAYNDEFRGRKYLRVCVQQRGLLVAKTDTEKIKFAQKAHDEKYKYL